MSSNQPSTGNISEKQESSSPTFDDGFNISKACCLEGYECMKAGKFNEAFEKFDQAIALYPSPVYYSNRAWLYIKMGKYDEAIKECLDAIEHRPNYAHSYSNLGFIFSRQKLYEEAVEAFKKAVELDPGNELYKSDLAFTEEKLEVTKQNSSTLTPDLIAIANALSEEGNECMKVSKYDEAIEKYTQAILLKRDPIFLCSRYSAHCHLKQYNNASNDSMDAFSLDGNYAQFFGRCGFISTCQGFYFHSVVSYKLALQMDPTNENYKENLEFVEEKDREAKQEQ